jgi:predicted neuraminidase
VRSHGAHHPCHSAPTTHVTPDTAGYSTITPDGILKHADGAEFAYLPAPTVQSHAANLLTLPDGRLGCVWFGGTQEGVPDISIWFSALEPGSSRWSAAEQLSDDSTRSEQNPILFTAPDSAGQAGSLWLLYTAQKAGNQDTAEVRRRMSTDSGRTWGPPAAGGPALRPPDHPHLPLHHHAR